MLTIESRADGIHVFWEPVRFSAVEIDTIEAEMPDGTIVWPEWQFGGRRLGFNRALPAGTKLRDEVLVAIRGAVMLGVGGQDFGATSRGATHSSGETHTPALATI